MMFMLGVGRFSVHGSVSFARHPDQPWFGTWYRGPAAHNTGKQIKVTHRLGRAYVYYAVWPRS